jgi:D-serine deaminase-like pyridoxal phosphate-dependent protein
MPKIKLTTFVLKDYKPGESHTVSIGLGQATPEKTVEIRSVADCIAALHAFAEELKPTGKPWKVSVNFDKRSGRKPAGFDAATAAHKLRAFVNEELAKG